MLWLLSIVVIILLVVRRWKIQKFVELSKELKCGIKSYPLIGHAYLFAGGGVNRMAVIQNFSREALKNGGITHAWSGSKFYAVSVDAVCNEVILKTSLEKDSIMRVASQIIGNGLFIAKVPIWRPRRKISAPTFNPVRLNKYVTVLAEHSESMVKQVKSTFGVGAGSLWEYMTTYTFYSVCETTLGVKLNVNGNMIKQLLESFNIICKLLTTRAAEPWLHIDALYKLMPCYYNVEKNKEILHTFVNEIIKEKRKKFKENIKTHNASGITLKKGCGVLISIWGSNRNPLYWGEDAEQFRPERFLEGHSRHPAAFLSFSYGPRNCLGYQYAMISLKTLLATFLRKYRVLPKYENSRSGEVNHEPMKLSFSFMMKDVDEFRVRLVERKYDKVF